MNLVKIGAAVLNQTPLDWEGNISNIRSVLETARNSGTSVVCFPELCITGYGCEDVFHSPSFAKTAMKMLENIAADTEGLVTCLGLPLFVGNILYNAAAIVCDRQILGFVCKQFLAGSGIHYEHRWFKPWSTGEISEVRAGGANVPAGDVIFSIGGVKIGVEICEDAWNPERPARNLAAYDVDIILNPSASHFSLGKIETRRQIVTESSRFCNCIYAYSNLNGLEAGKIIYDGSSIIAQCGKILAQGKRFSFENSFLVSAVADLDQGRLQKTRNTNFKPRISANAGCVTRSFRYTEARPSVIEPSTEEWEKSPALKEEEFTRAVGLGLFDYMRKSGSSGFVLSISGGLDSASIAVLVHYMVERMEKELGTEGLKNKMSFLFSRSGVRTGITRSEILAKILTCVYQGTNNSGMVTLNAAKNISESLGFSFYYLNINEVVEKYTSLAESCVGRMLSWEKDDTALQNIQARARGPVVWMIANVKNALLLTTSNRSEAAVGYATMDGDTCGGLCPLGGIDKDFLIRWMAWVRDSGPSLLGSLPRVRQITDQAPTAELRPPGKKQTDETDLMPYSLLNRIEKAFVREKKSPAEVFDTLASSEISAAGAEDLKTYIRRFFTLWQRNQWKRERYAPSFHLDDESLDPRSSCRYPILSGGFAEEFRELDAKSGYSCKNCH